MALLPLSSWCHCPCPCHSGIVAIVNVQAPLPLSWWCCCPCCAGAIANITGIIALVVPASLLLLRWPLCPHVAWASSPPLHRRCCPHQAGLFALLHWCCCPCHADVVALSVVALAPLLCRPLCPCCACVVQLICRPLHPRWAGMYQTTDDVVDHIADKAKTSATRATTPAQQGQQCQHNEGDDASTKGVMMPAP